MRLLNVFLFLAFVFTSCGSDNKTVSAEKDEKEARPTEITIQPMSPSPSYPDAAIASVSYQDSTFRFTLRGTGYTLGTQTADADKKMCANSSRGQHIHLIVDNAPYSAQYSHDFIYPIPDGQHDILAFLSRSYHESIKDLSAFKAMHVTIENNTVVGPMQSIEEPMLFYSRPKGTYTGKDADNIMLDFYFINAKLGNDYTVRVDVGDKSFDIDNWQPYILNGLPYGENTITLTLLDKDGNVVDNPYNPVSRTITLVEDKAEG